MKRTSMVECIVAAIALLAGGGCNGTTGKTAEANSEITRLKASLEDSQRQRSLLEKDIQKLQASLKEAESELGGTRDAKSGLEKQVQDLTTSRDNLEAKMNEFSKARASLETRVNDLSKSRDDLQKMVDSLVDTRGVLEKQVATLTKAKNAALEDARTAQAKVDALSDKLKAQTQQMLDLQEQIKTIRSVLQQMQQKLE